MNFCELYSLGCNLLKPVTENDFNKGYATGVCVVLGVVLLMLIIKIIFKIIFRRRRCSELITSSSDGDVAISVDAVADTVRNELRRYPSVSINKIRLYRIRKNYMVNLLCEYDGKDGGLPQITQKIKFSLSTMFKEFFGVSSVRRINLKFERLAQVKIESTPAAEIPVIEDIKPVSDVKNDEPSA